MGSAKVVGIVLGLVASATRADADAEEAFTPLAAWLREHHDLDLKRKTWPSYRALSDSVREGTSDVAWLPPVVYAWLAEAVNPLGSIVRDGGTTYTAVLVSKIDSKITSLQDLKKTRAAWVDPWSAAGYVVPRLELERAGVNPVATFASEKFYGSHRDALLALEKGECDVAGTFAREESELKELGVRVFATFGAIPSDVIAARRNLAPTDYERVLEAFRKASIDETARPLLRAVFGGDELREGIDSGHEALRLAFERATANGLFD